MVEQRPPPPVGKTNGQHGAAAMVSAGAEATVVGDEYQTMRQLGGRAYQVRAVVRAADYFAAQSSIADRDTGSWLIACAVETSQELAMDLDSLAKSLREGAMETGRSHVLQKLRARAHQLHAAARAADHFLEQDNSEQRSTGSWLVACGLGLADALASELEDLASRLKRPSSAEAAPSFSDVTPGRRATPASSVAG